MSWSSDNKSIAFSFSENKINEKHLDQIFVVDLLTRKVSKILDEGSWSPSFSPDNERIVFVKNYGLVISDRIGTCQFDVKNLGLPIVGDVSWSPDGAKWAVSGSGNIYAIDIRKFMGKGFFNNTSVCQ